MDMYIRKHTNPRYSNRIDIEEVKRLYKRREHHKISMNDQLEKFYHKCKNNKFFKHEVTYFFHAECLQVDELEQYQTRFYQMLMQRHEASTSRLMSLNIYLRRLEEIKRSKNSDYRIYGGVRATFVYNQWKPPRSEKLYKLCEQIRPMMFTQLWRRTDPFNIPVSTKQVDVIGFAKHTPLDDEDPYPVTRGPRRSRRPRRSRSPRSSRRAARDDTIPASSVLNIQTLNINT